MLKFGRNNLGEDGWVHAGAIGSPGSFSNGRSVVRKKGVLSD